MKNSDNMYSIDFAKLESKVENMSEKLNKLDEIEKTLQKIQKCLSNNHTDVMLLSKDIDVLKDKCNDFDKRICNNEKKINNLLIKVTSITTIISFIGWLIVNVFNR